NAATAFRPWRIDVLPRLLAFDLASMRPRPFGRGEKPVILNCYAGVCGFNAATAFRPWRICECKRPDVDTGDASMRPRPFGRGEPAARNCSAWASTGFNAATAFRPWRTRFRIVPRSRLARRFNAATAFRPWRIERTTLFHVGQQCFNAAT